jgi:hypothetical protein
MLSILPMQAPLLQLLVEIAQHAPAVVWLASALPLQDLAGTLREKLRAEMADRQLIMLRYGDPRVLPELIRVFDDVQRVHLGRGVKTWWWLDRANAIQRWQPRDSGLDLPQPGFARAAITLSDTQVGELLDASFADRVLDLLGSHHPTLVRRFDQAARYALVTELIKRARVAGLSSEFDCANFTAVAMSLGHDFAERGDWKGIMACVKAGELSFGDAIEKWEALHA